jgi:hypothetical protein
MTKQSNDFAGFLDGFEARNLASIERDTALQISEMQTRLAVIRSEVLEKDPSLKDITVEFERLTAAFNQGGNIVDRLVAVGGVLNEIFIKFGTKIISNLLLNAHFKGFLKAYMDAAEKSRNDRLIEAAVQVGNTFRDVASVL